MSEVKKINVIDLTKSEITTYDPFDTDNVSKMMKNKEIKAVIHDFYKKEHAHISQFTDDEKYRELIFKLYQHLGYKSQFDDFTAAEKTLLHLIQTYTDLLVNEFKDVLKELV